MQYVLAVYLSRAVAMRAYNNVVSLGVTASLASTPQSAQVGCGLCVKFPLESLPQVADYLQQQETFEGFFLIKKTQSGNVVARL